MHFAEVLSNLRHEPLASGLESYTALPNFFEYAAPFSWDQVLKGLSNSSNAADYLYRSYLSLDHSNPPHEVRFGCFEYGQPHDGEIQIHFNNRDHRHGGPLGRSKVPERIRELKEMFTYIKALNFEAKEVRGRSWLYNVDAYKRLFPPSYFESARPDDDEYMLRTIAVWGQFIDNDNHTKKDVRDEFLARLKHINEDNVMSMFPLPLLTTHAPLEDFYTFYGIE